MTNSLLVGTNVLFPVLLLPYLTRVLGPDKIGVFNWASAVVSYMVILTTVGLTKIGTREIGRHRSDMESINRLVSDIFGLRILLAAVGCIVLLILCIVVDTFSRYALVVLILATQIVFDALGHDWVFVGLGRQAAILARNTVSKLLLLIGVFAFVRTPADFLRFVLLYAVAYNVPLIANFALLFDAHALSFSGEVIRRYRTPEVGTNFVMSIMTGFFGKMDVVLLGLLMSMHDLGVMSTVYKVVSVLLVFITSWAMVLLPRSAQLHGADRAGYVLFVRKSLDMVIVVSGFVVLMLVYNASWIVTVLLGSQFAAGAALLAGMAPLILIIGVYNVLTHQVLYVERRYREVVVIMGASIVAFALLATRSYSAYGAMGVVCALVVANSLIGVMIGAVVVRRYGNVFFDLNVLKSALAIALVALGCWLTAGPSAGIAAVALRVGLSAVTYCSALLILRERFTSTVALRLRRRLA
ncbi:MAG: oligosaccharide flippase family protein [Thermoanaerobaculia bacterium]